MSTLQIPVKIKTATASGQVPTSLGPGELGLDPWLGALWWADNTGAKQSLALPGLASTAALQAALGTVAQQSDLNIAQQNILYMGLREAALEGKPVGVVDGILDPFSSTADINTGASSGFTFTSSAGTIGATPNATTALFHFDSSTADARGHTVTSTGSPAISTAQSKFGGSSLYLNGSSYLAIAANNGDLTLSTSSTWTLEGWFYPTATGQALALFSSSGFNSYISASGGINVDNGSSGNYQSAGSKVTYNAWNKIEICCANGTCYVFVNGSLLASFAMQGTSGGGTVWVGTYSGGTNDFVGYIDEVRISMGVARHTASYTPETVAFTLGAAAMTLQSATLASAVASPSAMRALIQVDSTSAALTPNTDLIVTLSRDGGTTFTQGTLALVQTMPDGTAIYDTGWVSVTGQPAGNSTMTYKVTTPTQKAVVLTGVSMQVKP